MQEKSLTKTRILQYLDFKGLSKYKFYQDTGITRGVLDQNNGMSEENTTRFLACYSEISPEWLLTGRGEMLKGTAPAATPVDLPVVARRTADHSIAIPLIPIEAVAGWNGIDAPGVSIVNCESYHIPDFIAAGAEFLIRVSGSSMYPKYSSGDILACRKIKDITFFQWGKIYVIDSSQGVMVKRLFESEISGCLLCKSDNDKYHPFNLPKDEIRSVSIVVGVLRLE